MSKIVLKEVDKFTWLIVFAMFASFILVIRNWVFTVIIICWLIWLWLRHKNNIAIFDENEIIIRRGIFKNKIVLLAYNDVFDIKVRRHLFPTLRIHSPYISFKYNDQGRQRYFRMATNFSYTELMLLFKREDIPFYCNFQ